MPIGVLTNPNSGKNRRCPDRAAQLRGAVGRHGVVRETRSLEQLGDVVDEFFEGGFDRWVCDGGDGTLHWLVTEAARRFAIRREDGAKAVWPSVLPGNGGSIDFVAHKAGVRGQAPELLRMLVEAERRHEPFAVAELDTLRITGRDRHGDEFFHIGFAAALGGVAQRFFDKLYERRPVDAWSIARVLGISAAGAVARGTPLVDLVPDAVIDHAKYLFEPTFARVDVDGRTLPFGRFASLQIGSIDISLGGVVRTFRHASTSGVLHAQALSTTPLGLVANLPNIVLGTRIWGNEVFDGPARRLDVWAEDGTVLDPVIDGEQFRDIVELHVEVGPVLRVPRVRAPNLFLRLAGTA